MSTALNNSSNNSIQQDSNLIVSSITSYLNSDSVKHTLAEYIALNRPIILQTINCFSDVSTELIDTYKACCNNANKKLYENKEEQAADFVYILGSNCRKKLQSLLLKLQTEEKSQGDEKSRKSTLSLQYASRITSNKVQKVAELYDSIVLEKKWKLKSGRYAEDVLGEFALKCAVEHPSQSLILDLYDTNLAGVFTQEEEEILAEGGFPLENDLDTAYREILNSLSKYDELEEVIEKIEAKGRSDFAKKKWLKNALTSALFLFTENDILNLQNYEDEDELLYSLWSFIKTLLIGTGGEVHGHAQANEVSTSTNEGRSIGGIMPIRRKQSCEIPDMSFQYLNHHLGCLEIGAQSGEYETKTLQEAYFKCPLMLKNQASALSSNIKQVGIVIDCNNLQAMTLEKAKGSLFVVKRSTRLTFPIALNEFSNRIIPIMHLMLNIRSVLAESIASIKSMQRQVPVYSLGKRKSCQ
ncbi:hypothetical protein EDC96DRAFT_546454 [Choanephora cucurbitarum]|nr:hypothetical protein EDC96DRAFT_546454 [Choanephora cucurbitarum]